MTTKNWHQRILCTETVFHTLAIAFVIRALFSPPDVSINWLTAAGSVVALGRSLPTEKVDESLSIPLFQSNPTEPPKP
ncbi:MAG TPA: hypothetical protein V6C88_17950 [Chroococcidiopsis sp.]